MDETSLQRDPTYLAFQAGLTTICSLPAAKGDAETLDSLKKLWWGNYQDAGWITPQIWAGASQEIQASFQWRPPWADVQEACEYVKGLLEDEGVHNYALAKSQQAERARTGVENRPGRSTPALPPAPEPPTAREVRRATMVRHAAIGRARIRRRMRLMAEYAKRHGLALGHCAIPDEAWKGRDEPTPEEIAAVMQETPPEMTAQTLYAALRPGERRPYRVGWAKTDGTALADDSGDSDTSNVERSEGASGHYVDVTKPDPPSPATVKERERVMSKEPRVTPYNEAEFKRDHPKIESLAAAADYLWPKVD